MISLRNHSLIGILSEAESPNWRLQKTG